MSKKKKKKSLLLYNRQLYILLYILLYLLENAPDNNCSSLFPFSTVKDAEETERNLPPEPWSLFTNQNLMWCQCHHLHVILLQLSSFKSQSAEGNDSRVVTEVNCSVCIKHGFYWQLWFMHIWVVASILAAPVWEKNALLCFCL